MQQFGDFALWVLLVIVTYIACFSFTKWIARKMWERRQHKDVDDLARRSR